MNTRYAYKVVEVRPRFFGLKPRQLEDVLNPLGQQGWRLVTVVQTGLNAMLYLRKAL